MNAEITEAVRGEKRARRNLAIWPSFSFLEPIGELSKRCLEGGRSRGFNDLLSPGIKWIAGVLGSVLKRLGRQAL
jgi:hypothetical protein